MFPLAQSTPLGSHSFCARHKRTNLPLFTGPCFPCKSTVVLRVSFAWDAVHYRIALQVNGHCISESLWTLRLCVGQQALLCQVPAKRIQLLKRPQI